MARKKKKEKGSTNITGILGLIVSLFFGAFSLYTNFKADYDLDRLFADFLSTFSDWTIIYSYYAWSIFLTIYGVLNLFEDVHETAPEKNDDTLVSRNFSYTLWWWGVAAVFYQQVALTVESERFSIIYPIFSTEYSTIGGVVAIVFGVWGLHHVIAGRIYINGYWDPDIHKYDDHKIVDSGIYKHVRHPIYGGQFLFTLSIFLMWNNWVLIFLPLATVLANYKRAYTEEKELDSILDGAYSEYKRLTPSYMLCAPTWSRLVND